MMDQQISSSTLCIPEDNKLCSTVLKVTTQKTVNSLPTGVPLIKKAELESHTNLKLVPHSIHFTLYISGHGHSLFKKHFKKFLVINIKFSRYYKNSNSKCDLI